jgi:hypothetical protein
MKKVGLLILLFSLGCAQHPPKTNVTVSLEDSDHSVRISGFNKAVIDDIGRDTANEVWQSLLPVYKIPADTDMKDFQSAQPGKYQIRDSTVIFTPDTAFKKGQVYFVRWYQYDKIEDAWQYIRKKKRTGSLSYKDLLFTY